MKAYVQKHALLTFFALTLVITWGLDGLQLLITSTNTAASNVVAGLALLAAGAGPSIAGVVIAWAADGTAGLRELFRRMFKWRVGIRWYVLVLVVFPAILLSVIAATILLAGFPFQTELVGQWYLLPVFALVVLLGGPLGEELGWRGFALPRLLERFGDLPASVILGGIWTVWHRTPSTWSNPLGWSDLGTMAGDISFVVLMTWVYRNTGGSALLAGLGMHWAANVVLTMVVPQPVPGVSWVVALCFASLAVVAVTTTGTQRFSLQPFKAATHHESRRNL